MRGLELKIKTVNSLTRYRDNMEESEVVSVVKNFMHHAAFNLINAAESNNPELMWAVMQNLESMVGSYIEAISEEVNVG
jgi:hypothetical protein